MFNNRFSLPLPEIETQILKNSYRLKLDLFCSRLLDDDATSGTIACGFTIEGEFNIKPGDDGRPLQTLIRAFRAAQAEKGGGHECDR